MTVKNIVQKYLIYNDFDGLVNSAGCGCPLNALEPCGEMSSGCEPCYIVSCEKCPTHDVCDIRDCVDSENEKLYLRLKCRGWKKEANT